MATAYVCRPEDNSQGISSAIWVLGIKLSQVWRHFFFNPKKKAFSLSHYYLGLRLVEFLSLTL